MNTPRTDLFVTNYAPLTTESCLAWARQLEAENAKLRKALKVAQRELNRLFVTTPLPGPLVDPCAMQTVDHALNHD